MISTQTRKPSQADKIECVQRILFHGSNVKVCAKRYGVSVQTITNWLKLHSSGKLLKRHSRWSPSWDGKDVIHHFVDLDVLQSIKKGAPTYEDSIISLFDPELDSVNCLSHLEWTDSDIQKLCLWMVDRSMELIRDAGLESNDFQEEMEFIESDLFSLICKAFGYDVDELRKGIYRAVAERAAKIDDDEELRMQRLRYA